MILQLPKRTLAILAFIALALSVIVPLSTPQAFSAPDCHRAEVKDYGAKIDKVVTDFTTVIKDKGSYGYGVHNERVYSPTLDSIVTGFGEGREIDRIIEGSKYSLEDILGEGAFGNGVSGAGREEDGTTLSNASFGVFSPKKTVDEAKLKEVITGELGEFLKAHPRQICRSASTPKPGCKKVEVKDYVVGIKKVVDEIEASKRLEKETGGEIAPGGGKSFRTVFYAYEWNTAILRQIGSGVTDKLILTEEQTKQVFGDGAKPRLTAEGAPPTKDEQGNITYPGGVSETFHAEWVEKFDREVMTKIITDKVDEFLAKNPQEICESEDTKPGDNTKPGSDTKSETDTKPGEATKGGKNTSSDTNNGRKSAPEGTDTNGDSQTLLEGNQTALATTGAVALTALGVSALLIGAGALVAIRRRKQNM